MKRLIFALTIIVCAPANTKPLQTFHLNTTMNAPWTTGHHDGFLDVIVKEVFRRVGLGLKIKRMPAERALLNANRGIDDGDIGRVEGLEKIYPNLIRVPEPLFVIDFVAFSTSNNLKIKAWADLNGYTVAFIRGWKILEKNVHSKNLIRVRNAEGMFNLLVAGRTQVIVYARVMGLAIAKRRKIMSLVIHEPPLISKPMYLYLHQKHRSKIPVIVKALRAIKKEGLYRRVYKQKVTSALGRL